MLVRGGRNLGTTGFFPRAALALPEEALGSFMMQYYANQPPPPEILVSHELEDADAIGEALSERVPGTTVRVRRPQRGLAAKWVEMTRENAEQSLRMRHARRQGVEEMFAALADELDLSEVPTRLECFDISHTGGEGTVASCVVFGPEGPLKKEYRRFNITGIAPGDDYAALRQALERRYTRVQSGEYPPPDILFIDGGAGQISQVYPVLAELGFEDLLLVGVAKGADRRPGQERLLVHGESSPRIPGADSPALRLIQRIRDEAHRFAIAGHRAKRARRFNESILETVPGLGPSKRRALLRHFGGLQGVLRAGVADFEQVNGIGTALARTLYDHLHPGA
jgi:excinuclease ABC subunit C